MNSRKKHYLGTETTNITYMKNLFVRVRRAFKNLNFIFCKRIKIYENKNAQHPLCVFTFLLHIFEDILQRDRIQLL